MGDLSYIAVSFNTNILAQSTNNNGDYDITTYEILTKNELADQKVHIDKNGSHFYILHVASGLNIVGASDINAPAEPIFEVLDNTYRAFMIAFPYDVSTKEKFSLQRNFESQLNAFVDQTKSYNNQESSDDIDQFFDQTGSVIDNMEIPKPQLTKSTNMKWKIFFSRYKFVFISIILLTLILLALLSLLAYV